MKFYYSPFVMPVGIIAFTVVSMLTNDAEAPTEQATDHVSIVVPADLDDSAWSIPASEASQFTIPAMAYPHATEVDFMANDTVATVALPAI